jgi:histidine triad (HIT) family protein
MWVMSSECLFCKVVSGVIPAEKVYEDEVSLAFRDINPQARTHILIVPKNHIESLAEAGSEQTELLGKLMVNAAEIARKQKLDRGYRIVINTGPEGGQTVNHLHLHVIGGRHMAWPPG